jgi:hypothetical protein
VFEDRVLRRIVGPKRDEIMGERQKLQENEVGRAVAHMGEGRNVYRVLVGKPKGKRPLVRPRHRWEDGIKMDLRKIGWGGVEWIHLAQVRDRWRALKTAMMKLRVLVPELVLQYRNNIESSSPIN